MPPHVRGVDPVDVVRYGVDLEADVPERLSVDLPLRQGDDEGADVLAVERVRVAKVDQVLGVGRVPLYI